MSIMILIASSQMKPTIFSGHLVSKTNTSKKLPHEKKNKLKPHRLR